MGEVLPGERVFLEGFGLGRGVLAGEEAVRIGKRRRCLGEVGLGHGFEVYEVVWSGVKAILVDGLLVNARHVRLKIALEGAVLQQRRPGTLDGTVARPSPAEARARGHRRDKTSPLAHFSLSPMNIC